MNNIESIKSNEALLLMDNADIYIPIKTNEIEAE